MKNVIEGIQFIFLIVTLFVTLTLLLIGLALLPPWAMVVVPLLLALLITLATNISETLAVTIFVSPFFVIYIIIATCMIMIMALPWLMSLLKGGTESWSPFELYEL